MRRVLWAVIGALLLAAGGWGLLAGLGALSTVDPQRTALTPEMISTWNRHETLATAITIVGGVLLALLGVLLLRALLRGPGGKPIGDLHIQQQPVPGLAEAPTAEGAGSTSVASLALHHALRRDLETDRQVRRAGVRLSGSTQRPKLVVRLAVTSDADIARIAGHLDQTVDRFTTTSGVRPELSDVVVRMPSTTRPGGDG